jgi:hypothetical protein
LGKFAKNTEFPLSPLEPTKIYINGEAQRYAFTDERKVQLETIATNTKYITSDTNNITYITDSELQYKYTNTDGGVVVGASMYVDDDNHFHIETAQNTYQFLWLSASQEGHIILDSRTQVNGDLYFPNTGGELQRYAFTDTRKNQLDNNATSISANTTAISANTTAISANTTAISAIQKSINVFSLNNLQLLGVNSPMPPNLLIGGPGIYNDVNIGVLLYGAGDTINWDSEGVWQNYKDYELDFSGQFDSYYSDIIDLRSGFKLIDENGTESLRTQDLIAMGIEEDINPATRQPAARYKVYRYNTRNIIQAHDSLATGGYKLVLRTYFQFNTGITGNLRFFGTLTTKRVIGRN